MTFSQVFNCGLPATCGNLHLGLNVDFCMHVMVIARESAFENRNLRVSSHGRHFTYIYLQCIYCTDLIFLVTCHVATLLSSM
jgi:hypothetical protein